MELNLPVSGAYGNIAAHRDLYLFFFNYISQKVLHCNNSFCDDNSVILPMPYQQYINTPFVSVHETQKTK